MIKTIETNKSISSTVPELSTCTAEPPTPLDSIVFKSGPKFRVYTCPTEYSFAAGARIQVAECFFGVWEPASLDDCFEGECVSQAYAVQSCGEYVTVGSWSEMQL